MTSGVSGILAWAAEAERAPHAGPPTSLLALMNAAPIQGRPPAHCCSHLLRLLDSAHGPWLGHLVPVGCLLPARAADSRDPQHRLLPQPLGQRAEVLSYLFFQTVGRQLFCPLDPPPSSLPASGGRVWPGLQACPAARLVCRGVRAAAPVAAAAGLLALASPAQPAALPAPPPML